MPERHCFTLRLGRDTVRRLDRLAARDYGGAPRTAIIRMAVARFLNDPAEGRAA